MPPQIRAAVETDAEVLATLAGLATASGSHETWVAAFLQDIQDSERTLLVAVEYDRHLGWCRTGWNDVPADALAPSGYYVRGLGVVPAAQRRGLGTLLLRVAAEDVLSRAPDVWSFYRPDNVASAVTHERVGFREQARGRLGVPGTSPESHDVLVCLHR